MRDKEDIANSYKERERNLALVNAARTEVLDIYNNESDVPLPELDRNERPMTPNLTQQGIDQHAMRIASTTPDAIFMPERKGKKHEDAATERRKATLGWWDLNKMGLLLRQRARHLVAFASTGVVIRPDRKRGVPAWHIRDPLGTFPAPMQAGDVAPADCIFTFQRSWQWIRRNYPTTAPGLVRERDTRPDAMFNLLEYVDDDEIVLVCVGKAPHDEAYPSLGTEPVVELERIPNRAGRCTAVIAQRVCLSKLQGQFDGIIGMHWMQSMLMSLEIIATKRGIFPDLWWVGADNRQPKIVRYANGLRGEHGEVQNATPFVNQPQPGFATNPTIDRIERAQRLTAGVPQELGGESTSNIRTGRRGDAVLSAAIDFPVQEHQDLLASSLQEENKVAVAVAKGYFGDQPKSFYVSWKGAKGPVTYTPNDLFTSDENHVHYSYSGADVNNLVISGGQRVGLGTMSKTTFMEIDPLIEDPETERDRVTAEALETALLSSIQSQAAEGVIPPMDLARIMELVLTDRAELPAAVKKAQEEAQARQAAQAPPGAPETQAGLGMEGMGAEMGEAIPEADPSLGNLSQLMNQLQRPAQIGERVA